MKQTILVADQPTITGRVYPKHVLEAALKKLGDQPILGQYGFDDKQKVELGQATHIAKNLRLEGNELVADIEIVPGPCGDNLQKVLEHAVFRPQGFGNVEFTDENTGVVTDYEITGINAVLKTAIEGGQVYNNGKKDNELRG